MDQPIDLCVLWDASFSIKQFCIFKDFHTSGKQDVEVTKSLLTTKPLIGSLLNTSTLNL